MNSINQIIYIPEYVEEGISKLQAAKRILEDISSEIEKGISMINSSGYNRGIPHIEKGDTAATALEKMKSIIALITSEIEKYSNGEALELESAIIIANPETIEKYGLTKEDIDYTLAEYLFENTISPKWDSNYLTASAGSNRYYAKDGRLAKETWCDLNPNNLVRLMKKEGIDLDYWIREDGVYMYGDYVMVAADIPHMDGSEQEAEYRKGDLVETSLGTGIIVDYCGMAEKVRKGQLAGTSSADVEVWYDIYTAWHDGGRYQHVGYCNDPNCTSSQHGTSTMIEKSENPTSSSQLRNKTTTSSTSQNIFSTNTTTSIKNQTTPETSSVVSTTESTTNFNGTNSINNTNNNISTKSQTTTSTNSSNSFNGNNHGNNINTNTANPTINNINSSINNSNTSTSENINNNISTNTTNPLPSDKNNLNLNVNKETNNEKDNINTTPKQETTTIVENSIINKPTNNDNISSKNNYQNTQNQVTTPNTNNNTYQYHQQISNEQPPSNSIVPSLNENESIQQPSPEFIPESNQEEYTNKIETIIENKTENHKNNIIKTEENSKSEQKEKFNPIPLLTGLGVATAVGVGIKTHVDKNKQEQTTNEDYEDDEQLEEI